MNNTARFISDLKTKCKENGIKLFLPKGKSIKYGSNFVSGYFDEKVLACAMGKPDSIMILVHESCHLDQFLDNNTLWVRGEKYPDIDDWLDGKEFENIDKSIDESKLLELDCEKRAVIKMKKYCIKFDQKEYTKKANSYVQFYNYLKLTRKWCSKNNTPYNNKNVYSIMPDKFMPLYWYNKLPDYILKAFITEKI